MKSLILILLVSISYTSLAQGSSPLHEQLAAAHPDSRKLSVYKALSEYYAATRVDSAVYFISEGMRLAQRLQDRRWYALLTLELGTVNQQHGNIDVASKLVNDALTDLRTIRDSTGIALAYEELGIINKENGALSDKDLDNALNIFVKTKDTGHLIQAYSELAAIHHDKGNSNISLRYYQKALRLFPPNAGVNEAYLQLVDHIGREYLAAGDASTALHYLQLAAFKGREAAYADTQAQLLDDEGKALERLGNNPRALEIYKEELQDARKNNLPFDQARALISIAAVLKTQKADSSLADLRQALQIADRLEDKKLAATIYKAMAGIYTQEKNYREAMHALDEHHRLLDTLFGEEKAKELSVLDRSYDLLQSREQVEHLKQTNKQQRIEIDVAVTALIAIIALALTFWFYWHKTRRLNQELENSNKIKAKLFSVLGHDLRGPVGASVQLTKLLEEGKIPADQQKFMLASLHKQGQAILETLESVLEWGRVQLKGVTSELSDFAPTPVIEKSIALLERQAQAKQINMINRVNPGLIVHSDKSHFDIIIRNLLSNAIKFSNAHSSITVDAEPKPDTVVFSVSDQGVGIPPEKLKLFESFGMATSFGTKGEKGTGLGLLLVKEYLHAEGGSIRAESTPGEGTTFYFTVSREKIAHE